MVVAVEKLEGIFLFNRTKLPNVNAEFGIEQVRVMYVNTCLSSRRRLSKDQPGQVDHARTSPTKLMQAVIV
jgi:hypothetical protein